METTRSIDVRSFAAERSAEIASVAAVLKASPEFEFGAPALKRFKRRRANAHTPYNRFKRPRRAKPSAAAPCTSAGARGTDAGLTETATRSDQAADASYAARRYHQGTNRRMRRQKPELAAYHAEQHSSQAGIVPGGAGQQTALAKHRWLAKRFVMAPAAGSPTIMPMHAHGKGRRTYSLRRAVTGGAVLRDISHWASIHVHASPARIAGFLHQHLQQSPHAPPHMQQPDMVSEQPAKPGRHMPQQPWTQQALEACCRAGGCAMEGWLTDSRGNALGPCVAEILACGDTATPPPKGSKKGKADAERELGEHVAGGPPAVPPAAEQADPASTSAAAVQPAHEAHANVSHVSLTVDPHAADDLLDLLTHASLKPTISAAGGQECRWLLTGHSAATIAHSMFSLSPAQLPETEAQREAPIAAEVIPPFGAGTGGGGSGRGPSEEQTPSETAGVTAHAADTAQAADTAGQHRASSGVTHMHGQPARVTHALIPHPLLCRPHHICEVAPTAYTVVMHGVTVPAIPPVPTPSASSETKQPQHAQHGSAVSSAEPPPAESDISSVTTSLPALLGQLHRQRLMHGSFSGAAAASGKSGRGASAQRSTPTAAVDEDQGMLKAVDMSAMLRSRAATARSTWAQTALLPPPHESVISSIREAAAQGALGLSAAVHAGHAVGAERHSVHDGAGGGAAGASSGAAAGVGAQQGTASGTSRFRGVACSSHCAVRFAELHCADGAAEQHAAMHGSEGRVASSGTATAAEQATPQPQADVSLAGGPPSQHSGQSAHSAAGGHPCASRRQAALAAAPLVLVAAPSAWAAVWLRAAQLAGAVIVGEQESRPCAVAAGACVFPDDCPATLAYRRSRGTAAVRCAQAAARRPLGRAPKLPVALPPWHIVGHTPSRLRQAYGSFWGTSATTAPATAPSAEEVRVEVRVPEDGAAAMAPARSAHPQGDAAVPVLAAPGDTGRATSAHRAAAIGAVAAEPLEAPAQGVGGQGGGIGVGDPAGADGESDAATTSAAAEAGVLCTLRNAHAAIAADAPVASQACVQRLAERLHAAVCGWEAVFGRGSRDGHGGVSEARGRHADAGDWQWRQVVLRVRGKGSCEEGAAVCLSLCSTTGSGSSVAAGANRGGGEKAGCGGESSAEGRVIGFVTSAADPAVGGWAGGRAVVSLAQTCRDAGGDAEAVDGEMPVTREWNWRGHLYVLNPYSPTCRRSVDVLSVTDC
eukprot:jgi/Ulvmu1/10137/UM006_0091.1